MTDVMGKSSTSNIFDVFKVIPELTSSEDPFTVEWTLQPPLWDVVACTLIQGNMRVVKVGNVHLLESTLAMLVDVVAEERRNEMSALLDAERKGTAGNQAWWSNITWTDFENACNHWLNWDLTMVDGRMTPYIARAYKAVEGSTLFIDDAPLITPDAGDEDLFDITSRKSVSRMAQSARKFSMRIMWHCILRVDFKVRDKYLEIGAMARDMPASDHSILVDDEGKKTVREWLSGVVGRQSAGVTHSENYAGDRHGYRRVMDTLLQAQDEWMSQIPKTMGASAALFAVGQGVKKYAVPVATTATGFLVGMDTVKAKLVEYATQYGMTVDSEFLNTVGSALFDLQTDLSGMMTVITNISTLATSVSCDKVLTGSLFPDSTPKVSIDSKGVHNVAPKSLSRIACKYIVAYLIVSGFVYYYMSWGVYAAASAVAANQALGMAKSKLWSLIVKAAVSRPATYAKNKLGSGISYITNSRLWRAIGEFSNPHGDDFADIEGGGEALPSMGVRKMMQEWGEATGDATGNLKGDAMDVEMLRLAMALDRL